MLDSVNIVAIEEQEKERVLVVLNVRTRPRNSEQTLQSYYEEIAYEFAAYEKVKISTDIDVELNPVNESALLRFQIKRPKKMKTTSPFNRMKQKRHAQ